MSWALAEKLKDRFPDVELFPRADQPGSEPRAPGSGQPSEDSPAPRAVSPGEESPLGAAPAAPRRPAHEVPPQYLVRAHPVSASGVQVMPMPPPPPPPLPREESAEEPPRRRASAKPAPPARPQRAPEDYYEYVRRITGQRGPQYRVNCIGNDGKPTACTWLDPYWPYSR